MLSAIVLTSLLPLLSSAATTHTVKVGNGALKIDPDNVKAEVGDTINFEFYPKNHSIAQASFDKPCEPMAAQGDMKPIFSGFWPVNDGDKESSKMFSIKINNTDPMWLYCSQASHCKGGQVMVINQKDGSDQTLDKFRSAASKKDSSTSPTEVAGGMVIDDVQPKTTKGNPNTPATMTYSSSMSGTHSTSTNSPTKTGAASKFGSAAPAFAVSMFAGLLMGSMCGLLT